VLSHLAGLTADVVAGNVDGAGSNPWTAKQVADRRGRDVKTLLAEWAEHAPAVVSLLDAVGAPVQRILFDIVTHEQDMRGALRLPGGTESDAFDFALQGFVGSIDDRLRTHNAPGLRIMSGKQEWVLGDGEPAATLTIDSPHELLRLVSGRRSAQQAVALDWDGDPTPYLPLLSVFGPLPAKDVEEA
jgi:uncharacterized protein (TIGR03083 family)